MKALPPFPAGIDEKTLALLGRLSVILVPEALNERIDLALAALAGPIGCDSLALYLTACSGSASGESASPRHPRELLLFASWGDAPQSARHVVGQGIPGEVALQARVIATPDAMADRRFGLYKLDRARALVAVPLGEGLHLVGVLLATWRQARDVTDAERILRLAATPLRNALEASAALLRSRVREAFRSPDMDASIRDLLEQMQEVAHFQAGTLQLKDGLREWTMRQSSGPGTVRECADPPADCPFLEEGQAMVLFGSTRHWPARCRASADAIACRTCLPMELPAPMHGALRLSYSADPPNPPTRYVPALEIMAEEAAYHLGHFTTAARALPSASPPYATRLEFHCFGHFQVERNGQVIDVRDFRRHGSITLLKLLLLTGGNPVSRATICELLWPGADPSASANRLHGVVHALRQAIEPHARERQWLYVCGRGDAYYFNVGSPHLIDFVDFRQLAARGHALEQAGQAAEAIRVLEEAERRYRGPLFEDEVSAPWFAGERASLHQAQFDVLVTLGRLYARQGDAERAVGALRRALRLSPEREDIHQDLMRLLSGGGRRKEALMQYDECVAILKAQLDAEPLAETVRLRDEILATLRHAS
jgi:DNA-binding SARP family transcriptional activator